jgi:SAM-dependent methyltransferase
MIANEKEFKKDAIDERLRDVFRLLEDIPMENIDTVLDIGAGKGELALHLSRKGKKVTCTGLAKDSYIANVNDFRQYGIEYIEANVETMPFAEESFDAVIICHVLEHIPNVFNALTLIRRVLKKDGLLCVFVPPQEDVVCAGHISVGWNIGQLMYVLLLNGFDVRSGSFINYGYNIGGFVRRSEKKLPKLRFDRGDIQILAREGFWPSPIGAGGFGDSFNGNIMAINWPNVENMQVQKSRICWQIVFKVLYFVPSVIKLPLGKFLVKAGNKLLEPKFKNTTYLS